MNIVDKLKQFIKSQDPILWQALLAALIITLLFYVFVFVYTSVYEFN